MYPINYFNLFPPFPREDDVFVAMSFDPIFDNRWNNVIKVAINRVEKNGKPLKPYRVDISKVSDSILTEILTGISQSCLIFADISTIEKLNNIPIRNGNVMYEVGLAHAVRLPEEVLLFRSDEDKLLFDVANIRVNSYDPDNNPDEAINIVGHAIIDSIKEIDLKKNLYVKKISEVLDFRSWLLLCEIASSSKLSHPVTNTAGNALGNIYKISSINKLLELGAISSSYFRFSEEEISELKMNFNQPAENMFSYTLTNFGDALLKYIAFNKMGINSTNIEELKKEIL